MTSSVVTNAEYIDNPDDSEEDHPKHRPMTRPPLMTLSGYEEL